MLTLLEEATTEYPQLKQDPSYDQIISLTNKLEKFFLPPFTLEPAKQILGLAQAIYPLLQLHLTIADSLRQQILKITIKHLVNHNENITQGSSISIRANYVYQVASCYKTLALLDYQDINKLLIAFKKQLVALLAD